MQPKLRFPEFSGDWNLKKLGNIAKFSRGKGISKSDIVSDGQYKCIRYGELYTTYNEIIDNVVSRTNVPPNDSILSKAGQVIIPSSGESALDIAKASCVLENDILLGGDLNIIESDLNGQYLSYYLNSTKKYDIATLAQGNSVVHLYNEQLKMLDIKFPNNMEQTKIADFLSTVDKKITLLEQQQKAWQNYKQGMMQKLFSGELRFKDESGQDFPEWEDGVLGDITKLISRRNKNNIDAEVYSVTNSNGFVLQSEYFEDRRIASTDLSTYKIIYKNEFAYNPARVNVGSLALFTQKIGIISSLYVCFQTLDSIDINFLNYFLQLDSTVRNYGLYGEGGVRVYLWYPLFSEIPISYPQSLSEQKKIADCLSGLDDKINNITEQLNQMREWKKGLLQQMFV